MYPNQVDFRLHAQTFHLSLHPMVFAVAYACRLRVEETSVAQGNMDSTRFHCVADVFVEYNPGHPPYFGKEGQIYHAWGRSGEDKARVKAKLTKQIDDLKKDIDKNFTL